MRALLLTLWAGLALSASAQELGQPRLHVLDNGLRVLTVEDHANPLATAVWSAHVGDSAEPPDFAGNSHYLEHLLLFRGTKSHPKDSIGRWVGSRGGYLNGHTWSDWTTFEITVPAGDLDEALERHEQMMFHGAFSGQDFETEKSAVHEELRRNLDEPYGYLWVSLPYKLYDGDTFYSRSTIGTFATVQAATVEKVARYYRDFYVPNNMTLALAGSFDTDELLPRLRERFGKYPRGPAPEPPYAPLRLKKGVNVHVEERELGKGYFMLAFEGPYAVSPEYFPFALLAAYLGEGKTALFQDELVAKAKLLGRVEMTAMPRRYLKGWQAISGEGEPDKVGAGLERMLELAARVRAEGVSEAELELARQRLLNAHRLLRDDQYEVASQLAQADAHGDYRLFSDYEARLRAVTPADVHAVARKYLRFEDFTVMALFPKGKTPEGFGQRLKGSAARHAGSRASVLSRRLPSGATLLHEPRPGAPVESLTAAVRAGQHVEGSLPGIAGAAAKMMGRLTAFRSKKQLQDYLDREGFTLSSWAEGDAAYFQLDAPAGKTEKAAALLVELLTRPAFPEDEWKAAQKELLADISLQKDQPDQVVMYLLRRTVFPGAPYGSSLDQIEAAIAKLGPAQLERFARRYYRSDRLAIAYAGPAPADAVERAFRGLPTPAGPPPQDAPLRAARPETRVRRALPMKDKEQAYILSAWLAPALDSERWILWGLAERAFGGDLAGRLWKLRQDEGLAYSVWFNGRELRDQPLTQIYIGTAAAKREKALAAIDREIRKATAGVTAEELARVKVSYLGDLARRDRTVAARSERLARWWALGLPAGRREQLARVVGAATLEDVNRVVSEVLDPERLFRVEAGAVPE